MYCLGNFHFESVHFGSFRENVQAGGLLNLVRYILAILGENVPLGRFLLSSGTFGSFCEKNQPLAVFYSQPVHFIWGEFVPSGKCLF